MISVVMLFGPCHGQISYSKTRPPEQIQTIAENEPRAMFQEYKFGEPYGDPRPSMMMQRHIYRMHDILENGTEEVAIYLHEENCCEHDYSKSRHYKENMPISRDDLPRVRPLRGKGFLFND